MAQEELIMTLASEPFGTGATRIIHNVECRDLLDLPVAEVRDLFSVAGALIFRGFDVGPDSMQEFARKFSSRFNRDRLRPPVPGTNGFVQMVTEGMGYVEPHSEQGNSPFRPDAIWFCCDTPAAQGGETLLWDGIRVWNRLGSELRELFARKRLRFFFRYSVDKWKLFLGEETTLPEAERMLSAMDGVSYHVTPDESIYLEYVCSAVVKTRYGGVDAFANNLLSERRNTLGELMAFEDGSPISDAVVCEVQEVMDSLAEEIAWEPGDLAFIDNSRFAHGRNAYTDRRRRIFSSLSFLNF